MATDTEAIEPAKTWLHEQGFSKIKKINAPVDFQAERDGKKYFIELKYTASKNKYFGAATLTEWMCAIENPDNFYFLFAHQHEVNNDVSKWDFELIGPNELIDYSTIPPFKIFFNIPLPLNSPRTPPKRTRAKQASVRNLQSLFDVFTKL